MPPERCEAARKTTHTDPAITIHVVADLELNVRGGRIKISNRPRDCITFRGRPQHRRGDLRVARRQEGAFAVRQGVKKDRKPTSERICGEGCCSKIYATKVLLHVTNISLQVYILTILLHVVKSSLHAMNTLLHVTK